jgi:stress-induced-phosphoprotein 1
LSREVYANRSEAHLKNCNGVQALADAESIIKLHPYWAKAYLRKGDALMYLGRYEEAASAFSSGLRVDPENSLLQSRLTNAAQEEVRFRQKSQGTGTSQTTTNNNSSPKPTTEEDSKKENRFSRLFSYAKEKLNL